MSGLVEVNGRLGPPQLSGKTFDQKSRGSMTREGTINALKQKAEQGEAEAQTKLALLYYVGKGVPRNWAEAAKWFRKAADQGDAWAQLRLGDLYHLSHGVPQNDAEGAKWWRKAAERRLPFAQFSLGRRCYFGQGVPQDDAEAYFWLTLAHFHDRNLSRGYPLWTHSSLKTWAPVP